MEKERSWTTNWGYILDLIMQILFHLLPGPADHSTAILSWYLTHACMCTCVYVCDWCSMTEGWKIIALFQKRSLNKASSDLPGKILLDIMTFEAACLFFRLQRDQTAGKQVETEGIKLGGEAVWLVMAGGLKAGVWRQNWGLGNRVLSWGNVVPLSEKVP